MSEILCKGMDKESILTDLCVKAADIQLPDIQEDDLAVIAMPVFAGRVPALAVETLRHFDRESYEKSMQQLSAMFRTMAKIE